MKTLVLPSGKPLTYELLGTSKTESELTISFVTKNTILEIETIFTDQDDIPTLLYDIGENKPTYASYNVFEGLTKDKTGVYRVTYQKDSLVNQMEQLRAENKKLEESLRSIMFDEIPAIYDELDSWNK